MDQNTNDINTNMVDQTDLKSEVEKLTQNLVEMENNWKRALADYKNFEKRMFEEKLSFATYSNSILLTKLLPVLDNMEMLEAHLNDMGIKLITKELKQILADEGVTEIEVINKDFDSGIMEAIEMVEGPTNKVVEVLAKGYKLKDRLLRPARVKVGKS